LRIEIGDEAHAKAIHTFVIRMRIDYNPSAANQVMYRAFIEPGSFIMERKMMLGVKERAEAAVT
jgi:hypothetical protein